MSIDLSVAADSKYLSATFAKVLASKDVSMLKRVPGIGPKAASRILVELADFIVDGNEESVNSGARGEAMMALESLGFKKDAIQKVLSGATGDTSTLVKEGLKRLQRL